MTGADGDPSNESGEPTAGWPVPLRGVTETVATTLGPNERWNAAALGVFAGEPATARTWGNTRTRRNFRRRGGGYVQFVTDPVDFAEAALSIYELDEPLLDSAAAWARVEVEAVDTGTDGGTEWEEWRLVPVDAGVERETVPTINRGFGAAIEATIAASRLGVDGYDESTLRERLEYYATVVEKTGGPREREAMDRVRRYSEW